MSITRLLDLFENAPLLTKVRLDPIPDSSDAPPGLVVSLPRLRILEIFAAGVQSSSPLLNHLIIPTGAMLKQEFAFNDECPFLNYLPQNPQNLRNILNVTSVQLYFVEEFVIKLTGPTGKLDMTAQREYETETVPLASDRSILRSLDYFALAGSKRLLVRIHEPPTPGETYEPLTQRTLNVMPDLRTLSLYYYSDLPFIVALNPDKNPSKLTLCPKLEKLVLGVEEEWGRFDFKELIDMAKERALRDVRLPSIMLICEDREDLRSMVSEEELSELGRYVTHVGYGPFESVDPFSRILDD
jgi:hypothetical protein